MVEEAVAVADRGKRYTIAIDFLIFYTFGESYGVRGNTY